MASEETAKTSGEEDSAGLGGWALWRAALFGLLVIGLAVLVWHFFFRSERDGQSGPGLPPPATVAIAQASTKSLEDALTATGTFVPVRGVDVAAELPGAVDAILFGAGDFVRKGAPLVRLDTTSERAQLQRLQAQLVQARAAADRADRLIDRGAISQAELEQAVASRDAVAAQIGEVRATIEKKIIRAPFAGRLGIRQVNKGQFLAAGTRVAQLVQPSPLFLNFDLPESSIGAIRTGLDVEAKVDGIENEVVGGRITAINPDIDPGTRNFTVQAIVANSDGRVRPGQFASVTVSTGQSSSAVTIPATAISFNAYGSSVFVADPPTDEQQQALKRMAAGRGRDGGGVLAAISAWLFGGGGGAVDQSTGDDDGERPQSKPQGPQFIARRVFVKTGERRGLDIEVLDGIEAGQRVVVAGQIKLVGGTPLIAAPRDALEGVPEAPEAP